MSRVLNGWIQLLVDISGERRIRHQVAEEIAFHIEEQTRLNVRAGMDPEAARQEALTRFGDPEGVGEVCTAIAGGGRRDRQKKHRLDAVKQDLRSLLTGLARRPVSSLSAILILALGLAASSVVITYLDNFSRPFPGVDPRGLVQIFETTEDTPFLPVSYPDIRDYAAISSGAFAELAWAQNLFLGSIRHGETSDPITGQGVSGNYFSMLGVEIELGRGFTPEDDRRSNDPIVLLSDRFWRRAFGSDPEVVGSTVYLNGNPRTVVGVVGSDFLGTDSSLRPDIYLPLEQLFVPYGDVEQQAQNRDALYLNFFGRLRPGYSREAAAIELAVTSRALDGEYPRENAERRLRVAEAAWVAPGSRLTELPTARIMLAGALLLLLLACANVANLLLSLAGTRRHELAVRSVLGASPARLARQLLIENLVLALAAGGVALLLAVPAVARLGSFFSQLGVWVSFPAREMAIDLSVFAAVFALAVLAGIIAGGVPALHQARSDQALALRERGTDAVPERGGTGARFIPRGRDLLVVLQVGMSIVLLVVSGLLLRTLSNAARTDPGFATDNLISSLVSISSKPLDQTGRELFFSGLMDELNAQPWVASASLSEYAPIGFHRSAGLRPETEEELQPLPYIRVFPRYFETLGLEILRGRTLTALDRADAPEVAVVNEAFVDRWFSGEDPLGRRLFQPDPAGGEERAIEVVGVVRSAHTTTLLAEPDPMIYLPYLQQRLYPGNTLLIAVAGDPAAAAPGLEQLLRSYDPDLVIYSLVPYGDVTRDMLQQQRRNAELFTVIALIGLVLAAAGIFSVMNLRVSRQLREIGIRMALGADRAEITRLVVGRTMTPVFFGLGLGLVGTIAVGRLVTGMLYGTEPYEPLSWGIAVVVLTAVALLAVWLPARRAVRVDPIAPLRAE